MAIDTIKGVQTGSWVHLSTATGTGASASISFSGFQTYTRYRILAYLDYSGGYIPYVALNADASSLHHGVFRQMATNGTWSGSTSTGNTMGLIGTAVSTAPLTAEIFIENFATGSSFTSFYWRVESTAIAAIADGWGSYKSTNAISSIAVGNPTASLTTNTRVSLFGSNT